MQVTAELRLWWPRCPVEIESWWAGCSQPARTEVRTDIYLRDLEQAEIGIKCRNGEKSTAGAEVKQLVASIGEYRGQPIELWVKSESPALTIFGLPTIAVHKARRLRDYGPDGTPAECEGGDKACHVELAEIRGEGEEASWWTLGFEASGTLGTVQTFLRRTLESIIPRPPDGAFASAVAGSYPLWLSGIRSRR